jgi:hypothetical protein
VFENLRCAVLWSPATSIRSGIACPLRDARERAECWN